MIDHIGVILGRFAAIGFGVYYLYQHDLGGACLMAFVYWILGVLLPPKV